MAIFFLQILKFTKYSIKLIEKLSRRHLINSSDVFVIKGFTVNIFLLNYNPLNQRNTNLLQLRKIQERFINFYLLT